MPSHNPPPMTPETVVCPRCTKRVRSDDIHTCRPQRQESKHEPTIIADLAWAGAVLDTESYPETASRIGGHVEHLTALAKAVNDQAEDEGLWFMARYASEAYLQQELRKLHLLVEALLGKET